MNLDFPKRITIVISFAIMPMGFTLILISYLDQANAIIPINILDFNSDQIFFLIGISFIAFGFIFIILGIITKKL